MTLSLICPPLAVFIAPIHSLSRSYLYSCIKSFHLFFLLRPFTFPHRSAASIHVQCLYACMLISVLSRASYRVFIFVIFSCRSTATENREERITTFFSINTFATNLFTYFSKIIGLLTVNKTNHRKFIHS